MRLGEVRSSGMVAHLAEFASMSSRCIPGDSRETPVERQETGTIDGAANRQAVQFRQCRNTD